MWCPAYRGIAANNQARNLDCADTSRGGVPAELRKLSVQSWRTTRPIQPSRRSAAGMAQSQPNLDSLHAIPTQVAPFPAFTNALGSRTRARPTHSGSRSRAWRAPEQRDARHHRQARVQAINATYGSPSRHPLSVNPSGHGSEHGIAIRRVPFC